MKKALLVFSVAMIAYLSLWPVPIEPVAWQAPQAPALEGRYAINTALANAKWLGKGHGEGPEDVAIDADGNLYVGYVDGRIVRFDANGANPETLTNTGGRPLGLDFDPHGNLIIADGYKGLLSLSPEGKLSVLSADADGIPFKFTDDVDVADDGMIYFSDASSKFGPKMKARDDVLEHGGHGRLLSFDPATQKTKVLVDGLQFANGIAVCPDQSCVLVTETGSYDIVRYWLSGDLAGSHDIFFSNLPGIPDGMSSNGKDTYWIALFSPRNAVLDAISGLPLIRKISMRLPAFLQPQTAQHAFVLGLSLTGDVTHNLQHQGAESFHPITSVEQHRDTLFFGSLTQPAFAKLPLNPTAQNSDTAQGGDAMEDRARNGETHE